MYRIWDFVFVKAANNGALRHTYTGHICKVQLGALLSLRCGVGIVALYASFHRSLCSSHIGLLITKRTLNYINWANGNLFLNNIYIYMFGL